MQVATFYLELRKEITAPALQVYRQLILNVEIEICYKDVVLSPSYLNILDKSQTKTKAKSQ